ncbi:MAG: hypothetical protein K8I00_13100, partial [Candidatus Omnitrophica bacterium]|nr:hypothetical protein [Candidatus Omnitrophota bacterium]
MMNKKIRVLWVAVGVMFLSVNAWAASLEQLRDQFKMEENRIVAQYDEMARQPGVNKAQVTEQMKAALKQNRQKFSALAGKDPRFTQAEVRAAFETGKIPEIGRAKMQPGYLDKVNAALAEEGLTLKSTGGSSDLTPSHINADVDAVIVRSDGSPATPQQQMRGLEILKEKGVSPRDVLYENAARFDNKGKDLTLWKPDSPEGQQAKLTDHDAFKTEGGRHVTRNPGAVQDAHGEYLDNRSKFEAARVEGDLKTQGKSLVKAGGGEAAGIKTIVTDAEGHQSVVRDSAFKKRNPELYEKAQRLKDYGTTHEAGITEVGDTPEVQRQKVQAFQEEMAAEMDALAKEAKRKGQIRDVVRENFQDSYTTAEDPRSAERARGIADERARVTASNEGALDAIAAEQQHGTARETFTGGRKGPGDPGFVADAPEAAVVADAPDNLLKTKVKGPSAANTNPGGMMEALGIPDNRPNLTPEQAGVEMPGRYTPEEVAGRTKWVQGDPELAKLAQPDGQKIGQVAGDEALAELGRGEGQPIDRARMKTGQKPAPSAAALDAEMAAQAGEGRLVSDESLASRRARMTGEKTPSLLEGG